MKNTKNYSSKQKLQRLTTASVLAALSLVLMATVRFPLFTAFYEMEFSDFPLLVCSAVLGPVYSIVALFVVCLIQTLTVSAQSGFIGFVMHFVSSALMIIVVNAIRNKISGTKGIVLSALSGVCVMTLVMIPMNIWLTSSFMQLPLESFISGYLAVCVAFNVVKSLSNIILYSILSPIIKKQYDKLFAKN